MMMKRLIAFFVGAGVLAFASASGAQNVVRVNITNDPPTINPIEYQENVAARILGDVYEGFTQLMPDGSNVPALATRWEAIRDGKGFRFHLRPGVRFHSGNAFTARDVKFTYELMLNPQTKATANARFLDLIVGAEDVKSGKTKELSGVTIIDDMTIDVVFTQPYVIFPIVRVPFFDSKFIEANGPETLNTTSAGTGPFKLVKWTKGTGIEVAAFDAYWGGRPRIDGINFVVVPSPDTVFAMYETGALDVADLQDSMFRQTMRNERLVRDVVQGPFAAIWWMGINASLYEPFKDKRVREAMSLSIDRDAMVRSLFDNAAMSTPSFVPRGLGGFENPSAKPNSYNPERARALMAEAGFPNGRGLPPVQITGWPEIRDLLAYYAGQFNAVLGMPVQVNVIERTAWLRTVNAGEAALFPARWSAAYHDPAYFLEELFFSRSRFNRSRYSNAGFDSLIVAARSEFDPKARLDLFRRAENLLLEDWASFSLPNPNTVSLVKPYVKNVITRSSGASHLRDAVIQR